MAERDPDSRRRDEAETRVGWRMAGIGFTVAAEVGAGVLLGWIFDTYVRGRGDAGVIVGAVAGIAVAMWTLIKEGLALNRELDRTTSPGRGSSRPDRDRRDADTTDRR